MFRNQCQVVTSRSQRFGQGRLQRSFSKRSVGEQALQKPNGEYQT
jgi:hypothetical protein